MTTINLHAVNKTLTGLKKAVGKKGKPRRVDKALLELSRKLHQVGLNDHAYWLRRLMGADNLPKNLAAHVRKVVKAHNQNTASRSTGRFNFKNGKGAVPAARHTNPDGANGGWVAATARVDGTCTVAPDAQVFGHVMLEGGVRVLGTARVCGRGTLSGAIVVQQGCMRLRKRNRQEAILGVSTLPVPKPAKSAVKLPKPLWPKNLAHDD